MNHEEKKAQLEQAAAEAAAKKLARWEAKQAEKQARADLALTVKVRAAVVCKAIKKGDRDAALHGIDAMREVVAEAAK